jgi:hypothetical protein
MKTKSSKITFWKPITNKKVKPIFKLKSIPIFKPMKPTYKRTTSERKLIRSNPWGDRDRDLVPNWIDCKPFDKRRQGKMLREEAIKRIFNEGKFISEKEFKKHIKKNESTFRDYITRHVESEGKRLGKDKEPNFQDRVKQISHSKFKTITPWNVIKYAEKYPMDIKTLEEVKVRPLHEDDVDRKGYLRMGHTPNSKKGKMILVAPYMTKQENFNHILQHELGHTEQIKEGIYTDMDTSKLNHDDWEQSEVEQDAERRAALKKASRYGGESRPELIETLDKNNNTPSKKRYSLIDNKNKKAGLDSGDHRWVVSDNESGTFHSVSTKKQAMLDIEYPEDENHNMIPDEYEE